jgi:hypothetical protein
MSTESIGSFSHPHWQTLNDFMSHAALASGLGSQSRKIFPWWAMDMSPIGRAYRPIIFRQNFNKKIRLSIKSSSINMLRASSNFNSWHKYFAVQWRSRNVCFNHNKVSVIHNMGIPYCVIAVHNPSTPCSGDILRTGYTSYGIYFVQVGPFPDPLLLLLYSE